MAKHKTTKKSVCVVLRRFADFLESDNSNDEDRLLAAQQVNDLLNEWANNDAFGTEAQCDPRGDQRD
jgi:hypothetical protein